uniref:Uncharacterized protein n=3 Tax=Photinus pyralis TaxID=7054 RepID=A0A1Y1NH33_PHOPY
MLYCLYWRQPSKNKIRIRCTAEVFRHISNLVDRMQEEGAYDVPYLFQQLKFNDAFKLVIFPNVYALEGRFMWQEKELQNDIFKEIKRGDPLLQTETVLHSQEFYGLNNICTVASDYVEGLRKYGISEKVCEAVTNLPGELEAILNQMESCVEGSESNVTESKAKQLKGKAFTSKVSCFKS